MAGPIQTNFQNPVAAPRVDSQRSAAQRAFFQAALTGTGTVTPAVERAAPSRSAPVQKVMTAVPTETPSRILRPGSFLDIRV